MSSLIIVVLFFFMVIYTPIFLGKFHVFENLNNLSSIFLIALIVSIYVGCFNTKFCLDKLEEIEKNQEKIINLLLKNSLTKEEISL